MYVMFQIHFQVEHAIMQRLTNSDLIEKNMTKFGCFNNTKSFESLKMNDRYIRTSFAKQINDLICANQVTVNQISYLKEID